MMEYYFQRQYFFLFFILLCSGFLSSSSAYSFTADWNHGWGLNASANNQWAGEYRFLINDTIVFKGSDSVLVVKNRTDFDECNTSNPAETLGDRDSDKFTFRRHGPFYFISKNNCSKGQKMIVVVLSPRSPHQNSTGYSPPPEPTTPSPPSPWAINPAILLVGSASLLLLILLVSKKKKKK